MSQPRNIFLFTINYPYGTGESYIQNEIDYLAAYCDHLIIFPLATLDSKPRSLPENTTIVNASLDNFRKADILKLIVKDPAYLIKNPEGIKYSLAHMKSLAQRVYWLENYILKEGIDVSTTWFYSYWFDQWATVLSCLKSRKVIPNFFSRAHGFDIYPDRTRRGRQDFRKFQFCQVSKVYAASRAGKNALLSDYPGFSDKIGYAGLGVKNAGTNPERKNETKMVLVSCANLLPLKRTKLIAEAIKNCETPVEWHHIGDGPERIEIEQIIAEFPDQSSAVLHGRVPNHEVLDFYSRKHVDLFILLSSTEGGRPVSIMEALSFSIPVAATPAGGIPEIVNHNTGVLLSEKNIASDLTDLINDLPHSKLITQEFRKAIRPSIANEIMADMIYPEFLKEVSGLLE